MLQRPRIRVLVIDDEEDICLYLRDLLERDGYAVTTCTEPRSALPEIKESRHQIVLLDVRMPEIDGVRMLHQIRAMDSDLCVIAMTAYPTVESAVETLKLDAFDYLRKPFDVEQLRAVLARAVREKGLRVDGEEPTNQLLGTRLRALRKQKALTLKQLANKTSLSVSLISQIELGKSAASVSTLRKLAAALASTLSDLFQGI
jgi:two-component system, OmpR family, response regulator